MEFRKTEVWGFEHALRGMRNAKNSWDRSDSHWTSQSWSRDARFIIGKNDMTLCKTLRKGGSEHRKFLRMIHVAVDMDMPRYWWSEMDTYHHNTKNSCSTMHKLLNNSNPITLDLFVTCEEDLDIAEQVVKRLEELRLLYKESNSQKEKDHLLLRAKRLLMEGFLQLRTVDTNYEEIFTMYKQRNHHRLVEEWIDTFCTWAEKLPYFKELCLED